MGMSVGFVFGVVFISWFKGHSGSLSQDKERSNVTLTIPLVGERKGEKG
jgi:hypothetical protein